MEDLYKLMIEEDMPNEDMKFIYAEFGHDVAIKILKLFPGIQINVPGMPFRLIQRRLVRENIGHMSPREMALRFGMHQTTAQKLLKEVRLEKKQGNLFEEE